MKGPQRESSQPRLALGLPDVGGLDAVIDGIPHEMGERIANALDERAIEFGVGAVDHQLHLSSAGDGEVSHSPWKLVEHMLDRLHPRLHRGLLQRVGDGVDPVDHTFKRRIDGVDAAEFVSG